MNNEIVVIQKSELPRLIEVAVREAHEGLVNQMEALRRELAQSKGWLSEEQAGMYCNGISKKTMADNRRAGKVSGKKFINGYMYQPEELDRFIAKYKPTPRGTASSRPDHESQTP